MFCAGVVIEEAAVLFTMTRLKPAICRRQGSRIICSICWLYLHLFKVFGEETLSFPKPTLCERPEGSSLAEGRAGQTPDPPSSRCCCRLPHRMDARQRMEAGQLPLQVCAWEGRLHCRGLGASWQCFGVLRISDVLCLLVVFSPSANSE